MLKYNAFIILIFLCMSCHTTKQPSQYLKTTFLAEKNYFEKDGIKNISVQDFGGIKLDSYDLVPKKNTDININEPILAGITGNYYVVFPGDSIVITYNTNEDIVFTSKTNNRRNNEFSYQLILDNLKRTIRPRIPDSLQFKTIDTILYFEKRLNELLPDYFKQLTISADSLALVLDIRKQFTSVANALIENEEISIKNQFNFTFQQKLKENDLYSAKQKNILKIINKIKNPYQVSLYGSYYIDDVAKDLLPYKIGRVENESELETNLKKLNLNFKGIAKDYILSKQIYEFLRLNPKIPRKSLAYYRRKARNSRYNFIVEDIVNQKRTYNKLSKEIVYDRLITGQNLEITSLDRELNKRSGKLILIDFWASWCKPCLEQMGDLKLLKKKYENNQIDFINISIDTDLDAWKRKMEFLGLDVKNSFVIESKLNQKFIEAQNMLTIPRLILIDKHGSIISNDTPSPGDKALEILISENLLSR